MFRGRSNPLICIIFCSYLLNLQVRSSGEIPAFSEAVVGLISRAKQNKNSLEDTLNDAYFVLLKNNNSSTDEKISG